VAAPVDDDAPPGSCDVAQDAKKGTLHSVQNKAQVGHRDVFGREPWCCAVM
jgi:hypothetical protein